MHAPTRRHRQARRTQVVIVTPAWAEANNGNWQTAQRWARHLAAKHTVHLTDRWPDGRVITFPKAAVTHAQQDQAHCSTLNPLPSADVLIALHAGRSAVSIQAWHQHQGSRGLGVVLTGTDLYRDLPGPSEAARLTVLQSLDAAALLAVLQDHAPLDLPESVRHKARVIFQSSTPRKTLTKPDPQTHALQVVAVGHLRDEKDPATLQEAAALLKPHDGIRIDHIGQALEPRFEAQALKTAAQCPHYRWLGGLSHEQARRHIQRAHLLVHTSRMEGGAHVIMEALCSGTPVLATRMAGNVGMLGTHYPGYFDVGDAAGLARLLQHLRHHPQTLQEWARQGQVRAQLFEPQAEARALRAWVDELLNSRAAGHATASPPV